MTLVLRKCKSDGSSRNGFKYGQIGERVTAPDWSPEPKCGTGLHGLKEGNGDWDLLKGDDWLIIEADDQIVDIDEEKCKFNTGIILFRGNEEELSKSEFPSKLKLNSSSAYHWAKNIGNQDIMIHKITDSRYAYYWARYIGNQNIMIDKIVNSEYAYYWAKYIGNEDVMVDKITESDWAYAWARDIGNKDIMIDKIDASEDAFWWAIDIGNHDIMKPKVTEQYWINCWNRYFPNNRIES